MKLEFHMQYWEKFVDIWSIFNWTIKVEIHYRLHTNQLSGWVNNHPPTYTHYYINTYLVDIIYHVEGTVEKKQIVKSFLSFSSEKQRQREKVSSQAETANNKHPNSLYQEREHPKQAITKNYANKVPEHYIPLGCWGYLICFHLWRLAGR